MPPRHAKIYIGTSGWMFKDWGIRFYPKDLKENHLVYFAKFFRTVEINFSFYRMPSSKTYADWRNNSSPNFLFSVKMNRYVTHRKRLIMDEEGLSYLKSFLKNTQKLKNKLAAILIQLPPSFKANLERLNVFLNSYSREIKKLKFKPLTAFEFRHESWFSEETYALLKKYKLALVISSTPELRREIFTANFTYIRMHGSEEKNFKYQKKDLDKLSEEIRNYPPTIRKIFIYFNNDYSAYAVDDAKYLISLF